MQQPAAYDLSEQGAAFIAGHEGFVSRAYRDPVGVLTIGHGFTNGSAAVRRHLGRITPGMMITADQARAVLRTVCREEFAPAARDGLPGANQHELDAGISIAFNVGPRVFKWKWAQAWRAGRKAEAARRMTSTATTAKGRRLPGLVRRRREESELLLNGVYGAAGAVSIAPSSTIEGTGDIVSADTLREYQGKLERLGFYSGQVDGLRGPLTSAAVRAFQKSDPHLKVDGILGRATMASIDRVLEAKSSSKVGGGAVSIGMIGTVIGWFGALPPVVMYAAYGLAGVAIVYLVWKYRRGLEVKAREILGV